MSRSGTSVGSIGFVEAPESQSGLGLAPDRPGDEGCWRGNTGRPRMVLCPQVVKLRIKWNEQRWGECPQCYHVDSRGEDAASLSRAW